jgi:5'-nucleotidase
MEAALQGIPAIGLSQYFGPHNKDLGDPFEAAAQHGAEVVRKVLAAEPQDQQDYRLFYNINFPPVPADAVKGTRVVRQGFRRGTHFSAEEQLSPNGRRYLWIRGGDQHIQTAPDSDASVNLNGYVSVTPMRADLTAHDMLDAFTGIE